MRHGIVLFTSDRGIAPADLAMAAAQRTLDPWVARATCAAVNIPHKA